jgi:feruloyl esterase
LLNSDNPDIRPFLSRGGKLLLYHGWSDAALPPRNTVNYYEAVQRKAGSALAGQVRLFMVPDMGHCLGGNGPSTFDTLSVLDSWVESGQAPERIVAAKVDNPMGAIVGAPVKTLQTRPLCAWPKQARWKGAGSTDDAANFSCESPTRRGS